MGSPCPNCKKHSECGCNACIENFGENPNRRIFDYKNDIEICPYCKQGFTCDAWLDAEVQEMKDNGTWEKFS
jgi:hypothetical protein